jgi:hypothetical protein
VVNNFINNRDVPINGFPRAFPNWILLDEQFNYVPSGSGFIRVEGAGALTTLANNNIPITKSGYLFLSNETKGEHSLSRERSDSGCQPASKLLL